MNQSGGNSGSRVNVPEAKGALDNMKFEIARELGINFKPGYNGDLSSRENGYVGGYMVNLLQPMELVFSDVPGPVFPGIIPWFFRCRHSGIHPIVYGFRPGPLR